MEEISNIRVVVAKDLFPVLTQQNLLFGFAIKMFN